ncbi:MAG: hypothetical protein R6V83_13345 [Candidatus Thorarchaeota archaeon]
MYKISCKYYCHTGRGEFIRPSKKSESSRTRAVGHSPAGEAPSPKAVRKTPSSKQKTSLSKQGSSSGPGESAAVRFVQLDLSSFGDETGASDNNSAVAKAVETLAAPGVMCPGQGRRQKPRPHEGPCPDDGGQSPCLAGVVPRYSGNAGQGKGGTQEFHTVPKTVRNRLSRIVKCTD